MLRKKNLEGSLIAASPSMTDADFSRALIFICRHSDEGVMGLIVNKPSKKYTFKDLLSEHFIDTTATTTVYKGGPVEPGQGFVLHTADYVTPRSIPVGTHYACSNDLQIIQCLATNTGPKGALFCLGYTGWQPQQLEEEILRGDWLQVGARDNLLFDIPPEQKWETALSRLHISPAFFSPLTGRS